VQLLEAHPEARPHRHHRLGEQPRPVGLEEPIQRPAEPVIGEPAHRLGIQSELSGPEAVHRLALAVDRLALHQDGAQ
jgi:hypothetical protein